MKKIKKLNKIILSEINQFEQKAIIGGRKCDGLDSNMCTISDGTENGGSGGSSGGSSGGGSGKISCTEGKYCFPSDGCSSWLGLGAQIANNL